jgi:hypothetical protein
MYLIKVSQQPQKPLSGSNQIWATTSGKKDTATSEVTVSSYTTIGIVRCTLGVATGDLAVKPYIPHKSLHNEFVANVLHDDMGMVIFDLWPHEGC